MLDFLKKYNWILGIFGHPAEIDIDASVDNPFPAT